MDSTDSSFVMVDHDTPRPVQDELQSLAEYFPSLAKSSNFVYSDQRLVNEIRSNRTSAPDQRLYIDELLSLANLDGPSVYPPASPNGLQSILLSVLSSHSLSSLNISSILYYLSLSSSPSTANAFSQSRLLPAEFSLSIRAFHSLDSGNYDLAIRLLSDPRIRQPDFVSKTIKLLSVAPMAQPKERSKLVLAYWRLTGLELVKEEGKIGVEEAEIVLRALCDTKRKRGVGEAWGLARQWGEEKEIERLMRAILAACFGDNYARLPAAQHLQSLLSFPFTPPEVSLLSSFCLSPPSSLPSTSQSLVSDWFLSLLISNSKPPEALVFSHKLRTSGKQVPSEERDRLLKALEATLTSSQKTALSIEISSLSSTPTAVPSSAPSQPKTTASSTATVSITQPAWVPAPSTTTPAQLPSTPTPRTLALARQSKLPPSPAPAPKPSDLPLSASPFVRKDSGGGQGVLKALRERQQQSTTNQMKNGLGSPAIKVGTPGRNPRGGFAGSEAGRNGGTSVGGRSTVTGTGGGATSVFGGGGGEDSTPVKQTKPTLAGFGSVRQQPNPQPLQFETSMQEIEMDREEEEEQGENAMEEDLEMSAVPSPPQQPQATTSKGPVKEDDFSRRIALDPAIQKTLLAASTSSSSPKKKSNEKNNDDEKNSKQGSRPKTPKRSRSGAGQASRQQQEERGQQERGDQKRRAVSSEPPSASSAGDKGKEPLREREKPDQEKTVKLPPGAFPGMDDQEEGQSVVASRRSSRAGSSQPEMREVGARKTTRRTTATGGSGTSTPRRSSRARSTSVAPQDQDEDASGKAQPTPRRKSSRASSLQPPEMSEVTKTTPIRRSSRLSNSTTATSTRGAGQGSKRSTRRGQKAIEEEEEEDSDGDE
ncbi:hypothetical protein JCM16303_007178 [Sporobolomyces ruberrimus]